MKIKKITKRQYKGSVYDLSVDGSKTYNVNDICVHNSSAGSLVCYLMDIVQVDPLRFGLYFERFLNPDRVEMPDIDVDFQDDRRGEVFEYVRKKYGDDKTAFINTFGRVTVKSAFRDVARAYKVPNLKINALSKQIEDVGSFDTEPELIGFKDDYPEVVEQATKLDGTIRQVGCHACGFVISSQPLEEVCVLERRKRPGGEVFVTNWDKRESESFGLLKVDILGLTTLSVLNHARNLIFERHGKTVDFTGIPLDDQDTIALFQNAETAGVFQFEGGGMRSLLKNIQPATFREIMDCTALYRPGSLQSGQTQQYVDIARGEAKAMYKTEMLKPILQGTNGQLVYQEQIMQIFNQLGNFTWAQSDKMRKIIGKKLGKDEFNKHKEHFVSGCAENGIKEMVAVQLFDDMAEFASYSFNLSHAVSYTLISFWAAYLKVHCPVEFFAASLSHAGDDGIEILINDMRRFDIQIDIPDINISGQYYQIDGAGNIRYPLSAIKGVGAKAVETILEGRKGGPFDSLEDFWNRINKRACNKRVVERLIEAGALESIGFKEIDPAKRSKNFIELIAGYNELSKIKLENKKIDTKGVVDYIEECENCAKEKGRGDDFILPHLAKPLRPNIMVINNKIKRQNHLLSGKVGQYLLDRLKKSGVEKGDVYVTGAMKCQTTFRECEINSYEAIKQEIKLVKPGLIICFVGDLVAMFEPKGKMAKLHGQIKYNSEFDTYVLFSYSPQYAFFQPDKAKELFESAMDKVALVIEGR